MFYLVGIEKKPIFSTRNGDKRSKLRILISAFGPTSLSCFIVFLKNKLVFFMKLNLGVSKEKRVNY